jgi:signal peptidase
MFYDSTGTVPSGKRLSGSSMVEHLINYTGNSMFPILKAGDSLKVLPYRNSRIRIGDVIVFKSPINGLLVVHRAVSVDKEGVVTKGDNARFKDNMVLQANEIIGKVVSVRRGEKKIKISGRFLGRVYGLVLGTGKYIRVFLSDLLRPAYRCLGQTGILRNLFSRFFHTKVSGFKCKNGLDIQLLWGRRVIGRRSPGSLQWHIRPPFRLFIDERSLPGTDPKELGSIEHLSVDRSQEQGSPFGQRSS